MEPTQVGMEVSSLTSKKALVPQCPAVNPSAYFFRPRVGVLFPSRTSTSKRRAQHTRGVFQHVTSPPSAQSLICGDFNAHISVWDDVARSNERGTALFQWLKDKLKLVLCDGTPTRASRYNQCIIYSYSDITLVDSDKGK